MVRKQYKYLMAATLLLIGAVVIVRFSGAFSLKEINIEPEEFAAVENASRDFVGENIFSVGTDEIMDDLLKHKRVLSVELNYDLPDGIDISVNPVEPLALLVSDNGREIFALDEYACLYPFENRNGAINYPIITGLRKGTPYRRLADDRAVLLAGQLQSLRSSEKDFYLAISNIELRNSNEIIVCMDGLEIDLLMYIGDLYLNINMLKSFLLDFNPDLGGIRRLDMRSPGMIIGLN